MLKQGNKSRICAAWKGEEGLVLELSVVLLPVFLIFVAILINTAGTNLKQTKLQTASDAAAHAGTMNLGPSEEKWLRAREMAIETIRAHAAEFGGLDGIEFEGDGNVWNSDELLISIERGHYRTYIDPESSNTEKFISLEDENQDNPFFPRAIPRFALANSMRVKIERHDKHLLFPVVFQGSLSFGSFTVDVGSTATIDRMEGIEVAPFAMPLCSLLERHNGPGAEYTFNQNRVCDYDRFFSGLDFQNTYRDSPPNFLYRPSVTDSINATEGAGSGPEFYRCRWHNPEYVAPNQHNNWGLIGMPSEDSAVGVTEAKLIETMQTPTGLIPAQIGQPFVPYFPQFAGGNAQIFGDFLWRHIINAWNEPMEPNHPPFAQALRRAVGGAPAKVQPAWIPWPENHWDVQCEGPSPNEQLLCRSRRFDWSGCGVTSTSHPDKCDARQFSPLAGQFSAQNDGLWHIQVPVVLNMNPDFSCDSPLLNDGSPYSIIGFISVNIYDTDFGLLPPNQGDPEYNNLVLDRRDVMPGGIDHLQGTWIDSPTSRPPACGESLGCGAYAEPSQIQPMWVQHPPNSNTGPDGLPPNSWVNYQQPCNVVRARVDCSVDFLSQTGASGATRKVRLIN